MPAVQKYFEEFHSKIKLGEDSDKAKLREKRELLLKTLRDNIDEEAPPFENFNQGSYSMHTGTIPLDGNYDIDVGLIFDCTKDKYPDPVTLKKLVRDALNNNGRTVKIRRPCVTVNYIKDGETDYHVDLAIYAKRQDALLDIAKGKESSEASFRVWEMADPKGLTDSIRTVFTDTNELEQYRRCIRYLKRWRDVRFSSSDGPISIALTVAAHNWFTPYFEPSGKPSDLLALLDWVGTMLSKFENSYLDGDGWHDRLKITLPVTPHNDLLSGMTKVQMAKFKERMESLHEAMGQAYDEDLPEDACKRLNKEFGDDFEVPAKSSTAKSVSAPYISTGTSA
jgi:hypothetical protein